MERIYALIMDVVYFEEDTMTELLGVFSTMELAEKALKDVDLNKRGLDPKLDRIGFRIEPYVIDEEV